MASLVLLAALVTFGHLLEVMSVHGAAGSMTDRDQQ
jgi:hypothetical protein